MITININEAKTQLSQLLSQLEKDGEPIRICRHGHPVADIVPVSIVKSPLKQNPQLKKVQVNYDPTAPLDPDDWPDMDDSL